MNREDFEIDRDLDRLIRQMHRANADIDYVREIVHSNDSAIYFLNNVVNRIVEHLGIDLDARVDDDDE